MWTYELWVCPHLHSALTHTHTHTHTHILNCPLHTQVPNPSSRPSLTPFSGWKAALLAAQLMREKCGIALYSYLPCHMGASVASSDMPFLEFSCPLTNSITTAREIEARVLWHECGHWWEGGQPALSGEQLFFPSQSARTGSEEGRQGGRFQLKIKVGFLISQSSEPTTRGSNQEPASNIKMLQRVSCLQRRTGQKAMRTPPALEAWILTS